MIIVMQNIDIQLLNSIKQAFKNAGWIPPQISPPPQDILYDAWVYPEATGVIDELKDGREIYAIKTEFLTIGAHGVLNQINATKTRPNGYSLENVALLKKYSIEQYITVSCNDIKNGLIASAQDNIDFMVKMVKDCGFTGIELDWEGYGEWTDQDYKSYLDFISRLQVALSKQGFKLMVCGPPIWNVVSQNWYKWKYEEVAPLVDKVVMMVYDNQYDEGVGSSVQPHQWALDCMQWLQDKTGDKGIVGIPSYGYKGSKIVTLPSRDLQKLSPKRNADGELTKTVNGVFYDWSDVQTMKLRLDRVKISGIKRLSVWHLGGCPWFK